MGNNDDGAVGDGTQETRLGPTRVVGDAPWTDVSGGDWHVCGTNIKNEGFCWGYNGGRLGTGKADPIQATTPQQLNGTWNMVSAGHFHGCGIQTDGQAYCWVRSTAFRRIEAHTLINTCFDSWNASSLHLA